MTKNKKQIDLSNISKTKNDFISDIASKVSVMTRDSIFDMLDPLDTICNLYKIKKTYDYECEKLELKKEDIIRQSEIVHHKIDEEYNFKIGQLLHEHKLFLQKCEIVMKYIENNKIEKEQIMQAIIKLQERLCDSQTQLEEKKYIKELISQMLDLIKQNNNQSANQLNSITKELTSKINNNNKNSLEDKHE